MRLRRFSAFLLGAWLAGSVFMTMVAIHNFHAVDRTLQLDQGQVSRDLDALGRERARGFLRYQASELNRWYFETWEWAQLGLGVSLLATIVADNRHGRAALGLCSLMLLAVIAMRSYLTPEIVQLGRVIDFLPAGQVSPERTRFWGFHTAYSTLELVKLGLGAALAVTLLWPRPGSNEAPNPGRSGGGRPQ